MSQSESPPSSRGALSRDLILDTAIALADAEGIDAITMRRIGAALGVQAMSLYHHVDNKQDLLDGMAGRLLGTLAIPADDARDWQDLIRSVAHAYRRLGLDHPAIFPYVLERPFGNPASIAALETVFVAFRIAGYSKRATYLGFSLLTSFVEGFTLDELHRRGAISNRNPASAMRPGEDQLAAHPTAHDVFANGMASDDETFEACLDLVIQALERRRTQPD
jgi:AcrR family transcriptional regulator